MGHVLKVSLGVLAALLIGFGLIQFIPVSMTNPAVEADLALNAPANVDAVLRRSCYDCHSHETEWPWYASVAPASWLVAYDVNEGREHLNFSEWGLLTPEQQAHAAHESYEEAQEGEMPLPVYLITHHDAELSHQDLAALRAWSEQVAAAAGLDPGDHDDRQQDHDDGHEDHEH